MKFSVITPEHTKENLPFLRELYDSLVAQTYKNWEWVVYCNGVTVDDIKFCEDERVLWSDEIREHERVYLNEKSIGDIKNAAASLATGDIITEVDHDDKLHPDCLQELFNVYSTEPQVGFIYTDCLYMPEPGQVFHPFQERMGWTHHYEEWHDTPGHTGVVTHSFPVSSKSVGQIWWAPDHVRSWRKTVYDSVGGYNPEDWSCDDLDLIIRTYLSGTEMRHIPKALYYYRVTGSNNSLTIRNEQIQVACIDKFRNNVTNLALVEAGKRNLAAIELGGGESSTWPGFTNIDLRHGDIKHDLNDGIPLPDNSVGVIRAWHILEHLYDKQKIIEECWRVLAHGGWLLVEVPSTDGRGAFQDPTHVSYWNSNSFWYYYREDKARFLPPSPVRFQHYDTANYDWGDNIIATRVALVALKDPDGERFPGELLI